MSEGKLERMREIARYTLDLMKSEPFVGSLTEEDAFKVLAVIKCNSFGLWNRGCRYVACVLTYIGSFFNHSCFPNVSRFTHGEDHISFRALVPIKAGSEVCISYFDVSGTKEERLQTSLEFYYFGCECVRCKTDDGTEEELYRKIIAEMVCKCGGCLVPVGDGNPGSLYAVRQCGRCWSHKRKNSRKFEDLLAQLYENQ
eukprot:TRINITY_DN2479_c0_g1_i1.p1 TRINITY_DN2479_c0_g1~~TRINITY_DN2479_c0_g1_i1.p1  ORF type:complete len:199 (+),score=24.00 TRINITY_DN2479_c0_g1_i1:613-1209(+)